MSGASSPMIVLIGLRGAGKSSVGRLLAHRLAGTFADLDDRTALALGEGTAGEALLCHGEAAFRRAEARELATALGEPIAVLALGGGTPTAPGAEALLRAAQAAGRIRLIYLRATPAQLRARIGEAGALMRPTLTGLGTLEEVDEVFAKRDPLYTRLAAATIEVGAIDVGTVVERICAV